MLLDVEVTDKQGNPMRGLVKKDFTALVDGRAWQIDSVDDLCVCGSEASGGGAAAKPRTAADVGAGASETAAEPAQFVLYMDFSELQTDGRQRAMKEAKRWVNNVMRPEDRVMIAGYATAAGLRTLCPFTSDRGKLIEALDTAFAEPRLNDPYPSFYEARLIECKESPHICPALVAEEYHQGRRSLESLKRFLTGLEGVPGRKQLILFHQNGNIDPGRLYGRPGANQVQRLKEVAAEATTSHVTIHPASLGDSQFFSPLADGAVDLGFDLADATGGLYNRGPSDLSRTLDESRRRCACVYRIGLQPPEGKVRRLHQVSVRVGGRALPHDYVTQSLTSMDRWLRKAQSVLADPQGARDLSITAGLVPVRAEAGRWELRVQVALDLGALTMLPFSAGRQGAWEVGAALERLDGEGSWEMLGLSEIKSEGKGASEAWVVHERRFLHLSPGSYRMVAFVRDRAANVFGGAEAAITLPRPGKEGLVGPVLMRSDRRQIVSTLPLLEKKNEQEESHGTTIVTGPIPAGDSPADSREPLEVTTFVCGGGGCPPDRLVRYITEEGVPILRFEQARPEPAGECFRITDRIEHWKPRPGSYAYHLRCVSEGAKEPASAEVAFEIVGPAPTLTNK